MARTPGTELILTAAAQWRDRCLLAEESVFIDRKLWTRPLLDELQAYYVDRLDYGEGDFLAKLQQQLKPSSADAKRLAAEMLWVMFLFPSNISRTRKIEVVRTIWSWSGDEIAESHPLFAALAEGIGSGGPGYNNWKQSGRW